MMHHFSMFLFDFCPKVEVVDSVPPVASRAQHGHHEDSEHQFLKHNMRSQHLSLTHLERLRLLRIAWLSPVDSEKRVGVVLHFGT